MYLPIGLLVSGLAAAAEPTAATASAEARQATQQVAAEYVVHPQLHPEKRVKEWTDLIEGTNGKELPADQSRASAYMNRGVAHMDMTDAQNNLPKDQHQKWILLAIEDLGRAIKADPRLKEARTNLAIAYSADQRTGEAIAQLDSAIELAPDYINAYSLRARTLSKTGNYEKAIDDYTVVTGANPEDGSSWLQRGTAYDKMMKYDLATEDYTTGIKLFKGTKDRKENKKMLASGYYHRGQTYAKAEKHRQAEKDFAKAVSGVTKPGDIANTHLHRSRSLEQLDDFEEAIGALSKAIEAVESMKFKIFPEPGWYATRAGYHRKVGDFEKAAKDYTRCLEISPKQKAALMNKANMHKELEQWSQAVKDYSERIALGSDTDRMMGHAYYNRGISLEATGDAAATADYMEACGRGISQACERGGGHAGAQTHRVKGQSTSSGSTGTSGGKGEL